MTEAIIFAEYPALTMENDIAGVQSWQADSAIVFENIFKSYFKSLHAYACTILKEENAAEEIVQNVFYKLWEKREQIKVQENMRAYLYRSVYHECLNHIKHTKVRTSHRTEAMYYMSEEDNTAHQTEARELEQKIDKALQELPEQCRTIFQLSRFEELKYREIAETLGISVKTVENQMGKALKLLRAKLVEYLPVILISLLNLLNEKL